MKKLKTLLLLLLIFPGMLLFTACKGNKDKSHIVTFMVGDTVYDVKIVENGEKVDKPIVPQLENYLFDGWYIEDEKWSFFMGTITENLTLVAKFDYGYTYNGALVTGLTDYGKGLSELHIAEGMTEISANAFKDSANLKSVVIPSSLEKIGESTFDNCSALTNVYYDGTLEQWCNIEFIVEDYNYLKYFSSNPMYEAEHFHLKKGDGKYKELTEIEIPETITEIREYTFYGFDNITKVTIHNGVTSIGNGAFDNCNNLTYNKYDNGLYLGNNENPYLVLIRPDDIRSYTLNIHNDTKIISSCVKFDRLANLIIPSNVIYIGMLCFFDQCNLKSLIFENPNGWKVSQNSDMSDSVSLSSSDLSNFSTAKEYLRTTYKYYYWSRG